MTDEKSNWEDYYQKLVGRQPRQLLLNVLEKFPSGDSLQAIDLGCGDGTETIVLLTRGWNVFAVDAEPTSIKHLLEKISGQDQTLLQTEVAKFEEIILPLADLIHASYSIPFCHPDHFPALWGKIVNALKPSGRFAGEFFGIHDTWADNKNMTFHTEHQVRMMLEQFDVEYFHEEDEDGLTASDDTKHWHVFTVIARRK